MVAGLKGDVHRRAARSGPVRVQRGHLGMVAASASVPALAQDFAISHDYGAHKRVWGRRVTPALGQAAGTVHETFTRHSILSPIRTLTVGAGLRPEDTGFHRLNPRIHLKVRGLPGYIPPGSPPVREFHPPPKVTHQAIPQAKHSNKATANSPARDKTTPEVNR